VVQLNQDSPTKPKKTLKNNEYEIYFNFSLLLLVQVKTKANHQFKKSTNYIWGLFGLPYLTLAAAISMLITYDFHKLFSLFT